MSETFAQAVRAWGRAAEALGVVEREYRIAGFSVRLRFAGGALAEPLTRALAHHEASSAPPDLTILIADSFSTGIDLAERLDLRAPSAGPAGWMHRSERLRVRFQPDFDSLHALDAEQNLALFWTGDARRIRFWEKSAPLLIIFHWWMALRGRHLVHGAALGRDGGGVLLVGRGGAGKSTTALACLRSTLRYAGDDYHLVGLDPEPFALTLYNSAKIDAERLQDFEELRPFVANAEDLPDEKALVFLNECKPEKLSSGFPIRAVLMPRVTHRRETSIEPASPAAALAALAPSTLFQLRDRDEASFTAMANLMRRVPCYRLNLGTDLDGIAPAMLSHIFGIGRLWTTPDT